MITPLVDEQDPDGGFIPAWIDNLAKKVEKLYVVALRHNAEVPLPENVVVYSLGEKASRLGKILYFYRKMLRVIPKVDVIFCHMFPSFTILAAPYAKLFRKPIIAWYAHGYVSRELRMAHFLANKMVTASKESLRIRSAKVIITGHGIDTDRFRPTKRRKKGSDKKVILSVGRISPIKNHETLIRAADILVKEKGMKNLGFLIVGGVSMASQEIYYAGLRKMVEELELKDYVKFAGSVPYGDIIRYYQQSDINVNLCPTGGLDKAVLEAMACEKPVIVSNETFWDLLNPYDSICLFKHQDPRDLAEKLDDIVMINHEDIRFKIGKHNREKVIKNHSLSQLVNKLVEIFNEVASSRNLENK